MRHVIKLGLLAALFVIGVTQTANASNVERFLKGNDQKPGNGTAPPQGKP
jgi:hypothetical protein